MGKGGWMFTYRGQPVMWVRGETYHDKVHEVERDVLPVPEEK